LSFVVGRDLSLLGTPAVVTASDDKWVWSSGMIIGTRNWNTWPQYHFIRHKSHMNYLGLNVGQKMGSWWVAAWAVGSAKFSSKLNMLLNLFLVLVLPFSPLQSQLVCYIVWYVQPKQTLIYTIYFIMYFVLPLDRSRHRWLVELSGYMPPRKEATIHRSTYHISCISSNCPSLKDEEGKLLRK
jgi:hypothetical protein